MSFGSNDSKRTRRHCKCNQEALLTSKLHIDFSKWSLQDAKTKKEWDLSIKKRKVTKVWKYFDVLKWWGTDAHHKFPLRFPLATIDLGKPYTNTYQEHCISLASWFDSKLMQCQKAEALQMHCLDAQNRKNVSRMTELMGSNGKINLCSKNKKHIPSLATLTSNGNCKVSLL